MYSEQAIKRLKVLKVIARAGPVARTQLPKLTGLSAGSVSQLCAELVGRDLLIEHREEMPGRGRPRTYLSIKSSAGVVLGASITHGGEIEAAFVDLAGGLITTANFPLRSARDLPTYVETLTEALRQAIAASGIDPAKIQRIGLAFPGVLDTRDGVVHHVITMPPGPTPFAAPIAAALGIPVTIENGHSCAARAEHWFGRAKQSDTFTLIEFGYDLGSARYRDGLSFVGANGINAELGHQKVALGIEARDCFCGGHGCIGMFASIYGLLKFDGTLPVNFYASANALDEAFASLLDRAAAGEARALAHFHKAGDMLGLMVANHVNGSDPGEVLVMLPDPRMEQMISQRFEKAIVTNAMPGMLSNTRVRLGITDPQWRWKGTAALALEQLFLADERCTHPARMVQSEDRARQRAAD